jgi:preprotein translocase subunit SecG
MFGARGAATVLSKATTLFGALFMITSLTLTLLGAGRTAQPSSVVAEEAARAPMGVPVTETAPPIPAAETAPSMPVTDPATQAQPPAPVAGEGTVPETPAPQGQTGP